MENIRQLFKREFVGHGLASLDQCSAFYACIGLPELIVEFRRLIRPSMLSVPFSLSGPRYHAFLSALIEKLGSERTLDRNQRCRLVRICSDFAIYIRERTIEDERADFDNALVQVLDQVRTNGPCPEVADQFDQTLRTRSRAENAVIRIPPQRPSARLREPAASRKGRGSLLATVIATVERISSPETYHPEVI